MKSTEQRYSRDGALKLNGTAVRHFLVQSKVGPHAVVIARVSRKNPAQVVLPKYHGVVEALPPDGADQPLHMAVLPRRARRDWPVATENLIRLAHPAIGGKLPVQ